MMAMRIRYVIYWSAMSFLLVYSMSSMRVWDTLRSFNHPADRSKYLWADAQEYYGVVEHYQQTGQIVVNNYKLPVYPMFLLLCSFIDKRLEFVFLIQKLLYIASFFVLACFMGEYINKALAVFYTFVIYQFSSFPNQILTEGLAYGLIVLLFAFMLRYLYRRDSLCLTVVSILTATALLLRGNFMALLINIPLLGIFVIQNRRLYGSRRHLITHLLLPSVIIFGVLFSWMAYQGLRTNQTAAYANYGWHNTATLVLPYYSGKDIEKGTLTGDIKSEIMEIVQTNINPYEDFNTTTRFIQEVHDTREVLSASCSSNREYPFCLTENRKRFWFNYYMTMYYYRVIDSVVLTRYKQAATHQNNIPDEVLSDMVSKDIVMEVLRNNPSKYLKVFFLNFARIYALPMSKEELLAFPHKLAHPLRWFFDNGYSVCFLLAGIVLAAAAAVKKLRFDSVVWFFFFTIFVNNICLNVVISLSHAAEERYWYLFLWMWFVFDFGLIFLLPTALYQKRLRKIGHEYDPDK